MNEELLGTLIEGQSCKNRFQETVNRCNEKHRLWWEITRWKEKNGGQIMRNLEGN